MTKKLLVLAVLGFLFHASAAAAQRRASASHPVEFGIDGALLFTLDDPHATVLTLPVQDFRVGLFYNDQVEFEPRFNLTSAHGGGISATDYTFELGVLFIPGGDRVGKSLYVRPFLGVSGAKLSGDLGDASDNSGYGGIGLGVKLPFSDRRLATRLEANYTRGFDDDGTDAIGVLFGLSFYTR